jgi:hypothetical protein
MNDDIFEENYEPMNFIKNTKGIKQFMHFLFDRDSSAEKESLIRDKKLFLFATSLFYNLCKELKISEKKALKLWKQSCVDSEELLKQYGNEE